MKVQDLHTVKIRIIDNFDLKGTFGAELISPSDFVEDGNILVQAYADRDSFQHEDDALKAAALFRASHKMQEALQELAEALKTGPLIHQTNPAIQKLYAALALSKNTAETVTP